MGIKITKKGLEHIKERLSQPNMDDQAIIRFESMSRSLVYFLQMKEGTIYAEEKEVKVIPVESSGVDGPKPASSN